MTLDPEMTDKARIAAARVAESEQQVQIARAEYHTLIRRMHLAGGSMREIAEAMGLSHQRVKQIVDQAGGSWWQRIWRTRGHTRDQVCTFCERPPSELAKLLAGPDVFICDTCVSFAGQAMKGARKTETGGLSLAKPSARTRCSFCSKRASPERRVVAGSTGAICAECLTVSRQILDDRGQDPGSQVI